jgi:very-short-patch-repair endonuclease
VIPYVEDRKNSLLVELPDARALGTEGMASLAAALKVGIQVHFQLEDAELAAEPLPSSGDRRIVLLYEAAEGGAGVLRRLVEEGEELRGVARSALSVCHFDPHTGEDLGAPEGVEERCEAACYDCLLSYYNQRDHRLLDRHLIAPILQRLSRATLETSPRPSSRQDHLRRLRTLADTSLEQEWLDRLEALGLHLPTDAQQLVPDFQARPDFTYEGQNGPVLVFVDGPAHDTPDMQEQDRRKREELELAGYFVLTFRHDEDWEPIFAHHESIFGEIQPRQRDLGLDDGSETETSTAEEDTRTEEGSEDSAAGGRTEAGEAPPPDLDLFEERWHDLLTRLHEKGIVVEPGGDVSHQGRVVGGTVGAAAHTSGTVHLVAAETPEGKRAAEALRSQGEEVLELSGDAEKDVQAITEFLGV